MGGGRKNLKRAVGNESLTLQQGQSIMRVVDLRGSNLIEITNQSIDGMIICIFQRNKQLGEDHSFWKNLHVEDLCAYEICKYYGDKLEVMDANGKNSLAIFPAKFQKSMWIKRGNFVVVDESGREEAAEFGRKVGCVVTQVLFYEQVHVLQKSPEWPEIFKSAKLRNCKEDVHAETSQMEENENSSEDDGLPPLEANTNRLRPYHLPSGTESESEADSDS